MGYKNTKNKGYLQERIFHKKGALSPVKYSVLVLFDAN